MNVMTPAATLQGVALVGLTGRRHQGKSTVAKELVNEYGWTVAHAFEGGKLASERLFEHITGSKELAHRMVHGDLKDLPSHWLPDQATPRYFLEEFGRFMGVHLGTAWTLELEVKRLIRAGHKKLILESLIYEAPVFKAMGGYIHRLERLNYVPPVVDSDAAQAVIQEDEKHVCATLDEVRAVAAYINERHSKGE